jgi:DNA-directed RNA polymerase specialized sigma24 family protein
VVEATGATEPVTADRPGAADRAARFERFVGHHEPSLRRALTAGYGPDTGREATAAALAYAWEHFERVEAMDRPAGYLFRVGQSSLRSRREPVVFPAPPEDLPLSEPALVPALGRLSERQRVCVVLVHGYGWSHQEVADLLGVGVSSVRNHLARGLDHLRTDLGEVRDA